MIMSQNFLNRTHIHAVLQHQRSRRMAELMGGILPAVQSRFTQALFDHGMDCGAADSLILRREKQRIFIPSADGTPHSQILLQRTLARFIQVDDPHLVALAKNTQRIALDILQIQPDQFRDPQSAVEKQRQDTIVSLLIFPVHRTQQLNAFFQRQILGKRLFQLGGIDIFDRIFTK